MSRLAILTPDPAERRYDERWPAAYARFETLFRGLGVETRPVPWTAETDGETAAALAILGWGYYRAAERWLARLDAPGQRLINAAAVLRWNTRKTYLLELEAAGAAVVPTLAHDEVSEDVLRHAFDRFGTDTLVVKPQVSAGAHQTVKVRRATPLCGPPDGPVLIQPFLPAVGGEGELSLFYFGGRFSHAARKVAAAGDFRIQPRFGGSLSLLQPDAEALATSAAVLAAAPGPLTYARVDLIRNLEGRLALMEFEAIEPDLYLDLAPDGGLAFARAVVEALTGA